MRLLDDLSSDLINAIFSTFLPTISKMPSTFSRRASTCSRNDDKPSPNTLKSERKDSKTTVNLRSLFRFDPLFFNLDPFIFSKFTAIGGYCQGKRTHKIMTDRQEDKDVLPEALCKSSAQAHAHAGKNNSLKEILEEPEKEVLLKTLHDVKGNKKKAASRLGINRTTLYNKKKKYKLTVD